MVAAHLQSYINLNLLVIKFVSLISEHITKCHYVQFSQLHITMQRTVVLTGYIRLWVMDCQTNNNNNNNNNNNTIVCKVL